MSKPYSGLFHGTKGALGSRIIPGKPGVVTGGSSVILGKNLLKSMGISVKIKWTNYQAQHIIPAEMAEHPVLKKIGIDLDHSSNGIFLRAPSDSISTLTRHRGYHAPYNEFVRSQLNSMNVADPSYVLERKVSTLQMNLRKLQMSGIPIYPKHGATVASIARAYDRINKQKKKGR